MQPLDSIRRKLARCQALAQDERGDPTTRETAKRQAEALMRAHGLQADGRPVKVEPIDWTKRTSAEAAAAGLMGSTQCSDGIYVGPRP